MSSDEASASSSSGGSEDSDEASASAPAPRRGAAPRGAFSRRNPRRYTTADIDREIAMYQEQDDQDSDEDNSGGGSGSTGGGESEDDDETYDGAGRRNAVKRGGKILSPVRRTGTKPRRKAGTAAAKKKRSNAKNKARVDSDDDDDASSASEEVPSSGEEWDQNASDANDDSDDEDPEEEQGNSSSDSDFGAPRRRKPKRGAAKKTPPPKKTGRGKTKKVAATVKRPPPARSTPRRATPRRAKPCRAKPRPRRPSSSDEGEASGSEASVPYEVTPGGTRRPRRACRSRTQERMHRVVQADMRSEREALRGVLEEDDQERLENSDSESDGSGSDDGGGRGETGGARERRLAAGGGGRRRIGVGAGRAVTPKKRGSRYSDDESYDGAPSDADADGGSDDEKDDDDFEASDDGVVAGRRCTPRAARAASYKDVDDSEEEIGTADEDSANEASGPAVLQSPARVSSRAAAGTTRQRARARRGRAPLEFREGEEESESESDGSGGKERRGSDDDSGSEKFNGQGIRHGLLTSPYCVKCPSTIDNVTMVALPKNKPHVCYVAPDGQTRHCFALDTLYRIAITAAESEDAGANTLLTSAGKLQFLQPPHFRGPMDDDLLDQIASRFGRSALVIEDSAVYRKITGRGGGHLGAASAALDEELDEFDEDGEYIGYAGAASTAPTRRNFRDCFERYIQELMGSTDVYCCPLCYNEADRRQGNDGDEEMWEDDESEVDGEDGVVMAGKDHFSFLDDPMTILGSLDSYKFAVASCFCFRRISDLKQHLKDVHSVDLREVVGNDLFKKFQIRAPDGLLQSWLRRSLRQNTVQGDMSRYWHNGENQSFVLLLNQMEKRRLRGELDDEQDEETESSFCASFPRRARRVWRDVSGPYLTGDTDMDMDDFIAKEGHNEEEGSEAEATSLPINPHFTPPNGKGGELSPEEQMLEHLRRKNQRCRNVNADSASSADSDGELEVLPKPPQYEELEEEDQWTKSKRLKMTNCRARLKRHPNNSESSDDDVFSSDAEIFKPCAQVNGSAHKRVIDDDGNRFHSATDRSGPNIPTTNNNGSARKRVMESSSSDEDSD